MNSTVKWYAIQHVLEEAASDVVLLLDSNATVPYREQQSPGEGMFEVLAACGYGSSALAPGDLSFTSFLTQELKDLSTGPPFSIAQLHSMLVLRIAQKSSQLEREIATPFYCSLSRSNLRQSIILQSYKRPADKTPTHEKKPEQDIPVESSSSRVLLSIRLVDEEHRGSLQDWKAWLSNRPDDIKDIGIQLETVYHNN